MLERVEDLGHEHFAYCRVGSGTLWVVRLPAPPNTDAIGKPAALTFDDQSLFFFAADGRRLLPSAEPLGVRSALS
jgi:multiple sugar transport system ATP-binding protein